MEILSWLSNSFPDLLWAINRAAQVTIDTIYAYRMSQFNKYFKLSKDTTTILTHICLELPLLVLKVYAVYLLANNDYPSSKIVFIH